MATLPPTSYLHRPAGSASAYTADADGAFTPAPGSRTDVRALAASRIASVIAETAVEPAGTIPAQDLTSGATLTLDVTGYFTGTNRVYALDAGPAGMEIGAASGVITFVVPPAPYAQTAVVRALNSQYSATQSFLVTVSEAQFFTTLTDGQWSVRQATVDDPYPLDPALTIAQALGGAAEAYAARRPCVVATIAPQGQWGAIRSQGTITAANTAARLLVPIAGEWRGVFDSPQALGSAWNFRVIHRTGAGANAFASATVKAWTTPSAPAQMAAPTATGGAGTASVQLAAAPAAGGSAIIRYDVSCAAAGAPDVVLETRSTTDRAAPVAFPNMGAGSYVFRSAAANLLGAGAYSPDSGAAVVTDPAAASATSFEAAWTAAADATEWEVYRSRTSGVAPAGVRFCIEPVGGAWPTAARKRTMRKHTQYLWDFGAAEDGLAWDALPADYRAPRARRFAVGDQTGHFFTLEGSGTAGTRTVRVLAFEPGGAVTRRSVTFAVSDPATAYAAANTYYLAPGATAAEARTAAIAAGAPADTPEARCFARWDTAVMALPEGARLRVLCGHAYEFGDMANSLPHAVGVRIDTFGTGADPIIQPSAAKTDGSMINLGGVSSFETTLVGLRMVGPIDVFDGYDVAAARGKDMGAVNLLAGITNLSVYGCDLRGFDTSISGVGGDNATDKLYVGNTVFADWGNYGMFSNTLTNSAFVGMPMVPTYTARSVSGNKFSSPKGDTNRAPPYYPDHGPVRGKRMRGVAFRQVQAYAYSSWTGDKGPDGASIQPALRLNIGGDADAHVSAWACEFHGAVVCGSNDGVPYRAEGFIFDGCTSLTTGLVASGFTTIYGDVVVRNHLYAILSGPQYWVLNGAATFGMLGTDGGDFNKDAWVDPPALYANTIVAERPMAGKELRLKNDMTYPNVSTGTTLDDARNRPVDEADTVVIFRGSAASLVRWNNGTSFYDAVTPDAPAKYDTYGRPLATEAATQAAGTGNYVARLDAFGRPRGGGARTKGRFQPESAPITTRFWQPFSGAVGARIEQDALAAGAPATSVTWTQPSVADLGYPPAVEILPELRLNEIPAQAGATLAAGDLVELTTHVMHPIARQYIAGGTRIVGGAAPQWYPNGGIASVSFSGCALNAAAQRLTMALRVRFDGDPASRYLCDGAVQMRFRSTRDLRGTFSLAQQFLPGDEASFVVTIDQTVAPPGNAHLYVGHHRPGTGVRTFLSAAADVPLNGSRDLNNFRLFTTVPNGPGAFLTASLHSWLWYGEGIVQPAAGQSNPFSRFFDPATYDPLSLVTNPSRPGLTPGVFAFGDGTLPLNFDNFNLGLNFGSGRAFKSDDVTPAPNNRLFPWGAGLAPKALPAVYDFGRGRDYVTTGGVSVGSGRGRWPDSAVSGDTLKPHYGAAVSPGQTLSLAVTLESLAVTGGALRVTTLYLTALGVTVAGGSSVNVNLPATPDREPVTAAGTVLTFALGTVPAGAAQVLLTLQSTSDAAQFALETMTLRAAP